MSKKKIKARNKHGYYTIAGNPYVSVTTFLKIINKPFLYRWYASMEREGIVKILDKYSKSNLAILRQRIFNYVHKKNCAADRYILKRGEAGGILHKAVETYLRSGKEPHFKNNRHRKAFREFLKWWGKGKYRILKIEKIISDKKLQVAGTMDAYVERIKDKKRGIIDWKTGKYIYAEHHLQNVVYRHLARKTYPSDFGLLVHIPQNGGKVKAHKVNSKKYPLSIALHALDLWRDINE